MQAKKKAWLEKLNLSVLKKKTPLLGFTILQLFILFIVIGSGTTAVLVSQHQQPALQDTSTSLSTSSTNTEATAPANTAQDNSQKSSSTQTSTNSTSKVSSSLSDQYGCIPQTPGYDNCVKSAKQNALTLSCGSHAKTAGDTYSAKEDQAQAAYDAVMAEWNAVKDQPYQTHSPYDEYATDAKTKYNAIEKPAYATYASTISSLNAQGCNEIMAYTDTSWAGY
jgi:cytoskeletal protein RodZ